MSRQDPKHSQKLDVASSVSLYDLLDNPNGPSYNELWEAFTVKHPIIADKLLGYANECARLADNPDIAETILLGAVKTAAFFDVESDYHPNNRTKSAQDLQKLFVEVEDGE